MPKDRKQGMVFGVIMSYAMAYGMEIYNIAIKEGIPLFQVRDRACPLVGRPIFLAVYVGRRRAGMRAESTIATSPAEKPLLYRFMPATGELVHSTTDACRKPASTP